MKRNLGFAQSPILICLLLNLLLAPLAHARKSKEEATSPRDPYATAEYDTPPVVHAGDLAYRVILFDDFAIPAKWESDARKLTNTTLDQAIGRLIDTGAFTTVARKQGIQPDVPFLVVKCALSEYRIVSPSARFFAGIAAGTSYVIYQVQVFDGKSGALLFEREVSTENNVFSGTFGRNGDAGLPRFLGNVLADYLALRARTDKGTDVLPLEPLTSGGAGKGR
jgi:hypothetical protein